MKISGVLLALSIMTSAAGESRAWTVGTGLSAPCHERITGAAYTDSVLDFAAPNLEVPRGNTWRLLSDYLLEKFPVDRDEISDVHRFLLVSLMAGVRAPDTDGHSITNLENLRLIHSDPSPEGQYRHSLRGPADDYDAGNATAVDGTRKMILDLVELGREHLGQDKQIITIKVYLDFYGRIDLQVYAPMFYLGQAAHAIQDTFSHTLRDKHDDYRSIVHVMNYIDAINTSMNETRDGLAHSNAMDDCNRQDMAVLIARAVMATTALFIAAREQYSDRDPDAILAVLDEWVTLSPGCNLENSFCDNPEGMSIARIDQTEPYLEMIFGCHASGAGGSGGAEIVGVLLLLLWIRTHYTQPHQRR